MNLLVFTKQPYSQDKFHDLKICPYDQEGFIAVLLIIVCNFIKIYLLNNHHYWELCGCYKLRGMDATGGTDVTDFQDISPLHIFHMINDKA